MNTLIAVPCVYGVAHTEEAIMSLTSTPKTDVLLVDNGAVPEVRDVIRKYTCVPWVKSMSFLVNIYVNPVWNKIIGHFLAGKWDLLCLSSADVILQGQWCAVVRNTLTHNPNVTCLPRMVSLHDVHTAIVDERYQTPEVPTSGTPGAFITLTRPQAELVFPIPECCKLWFGDEWIYTILRAHGNPTVIPPNLLAHHYGSQDVSRTPDVTTIIERDKAAWETECKPRLSRLTGRP